MMAYLLLVAFIIAAVSWVLGFKIGHGMGYNSGWDAGYALASDPKEVAFRKSASGEEHLKLASLAELAAARAAEHEALAELHVHPLFLPPQDRCFQDSVMDVVRAPKPLTDLPHES